MGLCAEVKPAFKMSAYIQQLWICSYFPAVQAGGSTGSRQFCAAAKEQIAKRKVSVIYHFDKLVAHSIDR